MGLYIIYFDFEARSSNAAAGYIDVIDVIAASLQDPNVFALLRRCMKMGQEELRSTIHSHLMQPEGCKARPMDEQEQDEGGAWIPSEAWWSKDDEIAMCHEVIGVLMD